MSPNHFCSLALTALLIPAGIASAQGTHAFQVDTSSSSLTASGRIQIFPLPVFIPWTGSPASFSPTGAADLQLTVASGAATSGQFVEGSVISIPTITASTVAGSIEARGIQVDLISVDPGTLAPASFSVDGAGNFTTSVIAEVVAGEVEVTIVGSRIVDLAGSTTAPESVSGTIVPTADGFRLSMPLDLDWAISDPVLGNGDFDLDGTLTHEWRPLNSDIQSVSAGTGGTQSLLLSTGGVLPSNLYLVMGSLSGTSPGTPLGSVFLPLNFDAFTQLTLLVPGVPPFVNTLGTLDAAGKANAAIALPAFPSLAGVTFHFAYVVLDGSMGSIGFASNAEPLTVTP
ncbi:MAG: hypothetical protein AAF628_00115 [Planctomycetota bacterium]